MPNETNERLERGAEQSAPKVLKEEVRQPETPEERRKNKFAKLHEEDDDARSQRRASELAQLLVVHQSNIQEAHDAYPAPLHRDWEAMTPDQQRAWNERRSKIDSANKAYNRAVQAAIAEHRAEDVHLAQHYAGLARKAQGVA